MRLICFEAQLVNRQEYGVVKQGEEFTCSDDVGKQLLAKGYAGHPPPKLTQRNVKVYLPSQPLPVAAARETKVITAAAPEPPKEADRPADGQLHLSDDAGAGEVAAGSDLAVSEADLSEEGTADPRGRRKRPQHYSTK